MTLNFVIILVILIFHLVRAETTTAEIDVREKAQAILSELRLTGNNSENNIQVVYAGKELKAKGVSDGDALVSMNGVDIVPAIGFGDWLEGLGETQTGRVGGFPLVQSDTIGENGRTTTDNGFLLKGFVRVQVVPLGDVTTLGFSLSGGATYLHHEECPTTVAAEGESDYEQKKHLSNTNQVLQSGKRMKEQHPKILNVDDEGKEKLDKVKDSTSGKTGSSNDQENPRVPLNRPISDKLDALSIKNRRQAGEGFTYAAMFDEVGPMGIVFNMTAGEETKVSQVVVGSPAHKLGVAAGDAIIFVNKNDCSGLDQSIIGRMVLEAEWPRILEFRVPETISEPESQRLSLYIFSPPIFRGVHEVQTPIGWGGNLTSDSTSSCKPVPIVSASPEFACKSGGTLKPLPPPNYSSAIVLVKRGICSFVDKAANVQKLIDTALHGAGSIGRGSMVLINTKEEFAAMPAGIADTTSIGINAAMMLPSVGIHILRVLNWEKSINITGALAPQGECSPVFRERSTNISDSDINGENGEIVVMSSQGEERTFSYKLAKFGPPASKFPVTIIPADPNTACDAASLRIRVAGSYVIAQRGGCSFGHKARAMQKAGAAGLIITNSDNSTLHMQGTEEDAKTVTVPCVMAPSTLWQWVISQVPPQSDIIGRLYSSSSQYTVAG